jgi:hypothetical protein
LSCSRLLRQHVAQLRLSTPTMCAMRRDHGFCVLARGLVHRPTHRIRPWPTHAYGGNPQGAWWLAAGVTVLSSAHVEASVAPVPRAPRTDRHGHRPVTWLRVLLPELRHPVACIIVSSVLQQSTYVGNMRLSSQPNMHSLLLCHTSSSAEYRTR